MFVKNNIIPVFIPELACPFQCLYCNQRKISGTQQTPSDDEILEIIDEHLKTIPPQNHIEIGFFGGNFTGLSIDEQKHFLELIQRYIKNKKIHSIRCSTRPDYINEEKLNLLKRYDLKTVELGAQSMNDEVLMKSGRGHTVKDIVQASELIKKHGFNLGLQMMIGLPGDSKEKSIYTAKKIIELGAENTRIYPTLVIRGTELERLLLEKKYSPLLLDEAVDWTSEILPMFEEAKVKVLRVGLHPSEGLCEGSDLVAGPFHPSFRELVYTEIWRKQFESIEAKTESVEILVSPKEFNYAVGYNKQNKSYLLTRFGRVKIKSDPDIQGRNFNLKFT